MQNDQRAVEEMILNKCTNFKDADASMDINFMMNLLIPNIWYRLCINITGDLRQRAINVWNNCGGIGDISTVTYGQVADQHHALTRYCDFIFLKSRDIRNQDAEVKKNGLWL